MDGDAYSEMKRTEAEHLRDPDNLLHWPIDKLRAEVESQRKALANLHAQISRLQALCSSTGTGRPFFPG